MKKLLSVLCVSALALSLFAGCGDDSATETTSAAEATTSASAGKGSMVEEETEADLGIELDDELTSEEESDIAAGSLSAEDSSVEITTLA